MNQQISGCQNITSTGYDPEKGREHPDNFGPTLAIPELVSLTAEYGFPTVLEMMTCTLSVPVHLRVLYFQLKRIVESYPENEILNFLISNCKAEQAFLAESEVPQDIIEFETWGNLAQMLQDSMKV